MPPDAYGCCNVGTVGDRQFNDQAIRLQPKMLFREERKWPFVIRLIVQLQGHTVFCSGDDMPGTAMGWSVYGIGRKRWMWTKTVRLAVLNERSAVKAVMIRGKRVCSSPRPVVWLEHIRLRGYKYIAHVCMRQMGHTPTPVGTKAG